METLSGNHKVVYLTGAPASGKSTLSEALAAKFSEVSLFTYSKELAKHVSQDQGREHDQIAKHRESAHLVTSAMVAELDSKLIEFVAKRNRGQTITPCAFGNEFLTASASVGLIASFHSGHRSGSREYIIKSLLPMLFSIENLEF